MWTPRAYFPHFTIIDYCAVDVNLLSCYIIVVAVIVVAAGAAGAALVLRKSNQGRDMIQDTVCALPPSAIESDMTSCRLLQRAYCSCDSRGDGDNREASYGTSQQFAVAAAG